MEPDFEFLAALDSYQTEWRANNKPTESIGCVHYPQPVRTLDNAAIVRRPKAIRKPIVTYGTEPDNISVSNPIAADARQSTIAKQRAHWLAGHQYAADHADEWNSTQAELDFAKWQGEILHVGCNCKNTGISWSRRILLTFRQRRGSRFGCGTAITISTNDCERSRAGIRISRGSNASQIIAIRRNGMLLRLEIGLE